MPRAGSGDTNKATDTAKAAGEEAYKHSTYILPVKLLERRSLVLQHVTLTVMVPTTLLSAHQQPAAFKKLSYGVDAGS